MKEKKIHTIFIDTKIDKTQKSSNFKVKLNNGYLRNKILNNDNSKNEWYISIKSLAMFNSFSNITSGINDKIILYVAKDDTKPMLVIGSNDTDYDKHEIIIPVGNPNVFDLQNYINNEINKYDIECIYDNYNSTFKFKNLDSSTNKIKKVFNFYNTYDLLGFNENELYLLNNTSIKIFQSNNNVNLMADRLLKFSIGGNSDFAIKNMNYCNSLSGIFSDCSMFHLQPVNCLPYDLIYYERSTDNLIPIELYKNNIRDFEIVVRNNDNQPVEGLGDFIMVLDFIQIKTINYDYKIYRILRELYLWITMVINKKRWF